MFENCRTAEDLKKEYHRAAIRLHPDNGGNEEEFKSMQAEFAKVFDRLKNVHLNKDGEMYEKTGEYASTETAEEFMEIIEQLMSFTGIEIEICGSWLWVSGDTRQIKDDLKEIGCKWSSNKKMWYYQRDGRRRYSKKPWTIEQIRGVYGSQKVRYGAKIGIETEG